MPYQVQRFSFPQSSIGQGNTVVDVLNQWFGYNPTLTPILITLVSLSSRLFR